MKHTYSRLMVLSLLLLFYFDRSCAEGFAKGTLVKVPDGYAKIEDIHVGDRVICYDAQNNFVESAVIDAAHTTINRYVRIALAEEVICAAVDQRIYDEKRDIWISVVSLKNGDVLSGHALAIEMIEESIDVYMLSIAKHHNFLVSKIDLCVHNFFPVALFGISVLFGGGAEFAGISIGLAGLGGYLGYRWHKKNEQNEFVLSSMAFDKNAEFEDIYNLEDAQAPGMPTEEDGYHPPKKWDGKKKTHPINGKVGWPDKKGKIWVPTGVGPNAHGGPHWDVQHPNGRDYDNVYPGGIIRPGR